MKNLLIIIMSVFYLLINPAFSLDSFFKSLGGQVNESAPGSYQDQAAGYYTGGGYVMRQNNAVVQPIALSLPRLGAGCNSLDMYFGSFSFLRTDKLVDLGRQVISGVPTYGFQLALKTMSPQIENLLSQLRKYVQDMNATMLNSCQATQQIVGGLWPKGTAASEQICIDQSLSRDVDWFGARKHCENPRVVDEKIAASQERFRDLLMGDYNLVWHVLQKIPAYKKDHALAAFVMSLTGTLIATREEGKNRLRIVEPKADQKDFIGAYLKGGVTSGLTCNEEAKCLAPLLAQITIPDTEAMKAKVIRRISELRTKYISKEAITADEVHFLNDAVNLPVYRYIQVSVAAGTSFMMADAAEYIGANILLAQFDRVISEVLAAVDMIQKIQLEDSAIADFKKNLQAARARVQAMLIGANNGSIHALNQSIQAIEQSVIARNS